MSVSFISSADTAAQVAAGSAVLLDVRTTAEAQQAYVPHSIFLPHEILTKERLEDLGLTDKKLVFLCHSGNRAEIAAKRISKVLGNVAVLKGGIEQWKKDGQTVASTCNAVMPMNRQVLIAAGGMILISLALAALVSPKFLWWTTFVGGGLTFAGISGFCGMAKLLKRMPWNQKKGPECS